METSNVVTSGPPPNISTMEKEVKQSKKIKLAKGTMNDFNVGHSIILNISTSVRLLWDAIFQK